MRTIIITIVAGLYLFTSEVFAQTNQEAGTLTFKVTGLEDNSGQVLVYLYRKDDDVPSKPFKKVKSKIENKESTVSISNLAYDEYAAIIVHDKNGNGEIDHKWGFPAEPLGYTNHWELSLFSGMPNFNKLKITFSELENYFIIMM